MLGFIDRARFIAISLSSLANNLSEAIHKIKCKYRHDNKYCELNVNVATFFLNTQTLKMI